jgi:hypothetical protein
MISWWSKHVGVLSSVLTCDILNVLLYTSAFVGPLYLVNWNAWWNRNCKLVQFLEFTTHQKFFISQLGSRLWVWESLLYSPSCDLLWTLHRQLFIWGARKLGTWVSGGRVVYIPMICPLMHNSHYLHYTLNPSALVVIIFVKENRHTHTHTRTHTVSLTHF